MEMTILKNIISYSGFYYMMGFALIVQDIQGQLTAAMPGVPAGYEVSLTLSRYGPFPDAWRPPDGGTVTFVRDHTGKVTAMGAGGFELAKIPTGDGPRPTRGRAFARAQNGIDPRKKRLHLLRC